MTAQMSHVIMAVDALMVLIPTHVSVQMGTREMIVTLVSTSSYD